MAVFKPEQVPAVLPWNVEQSIGAGRPWDGCGVRYNAVTVGQPFTMVTTDGPEDARALLILAGTGTITIKQVNAVGTDTITFPVAAPFILPLACSQVTAVTGSVASIYWIS